MEKFKDFEKMTENKFGYRIKVLRADNGREYSNLTMNSYLKLRGIRFENTATYTPKQSGKAECENRTIVESARTMIHAKNLSLRLWAEAINTATYLLNRTLVPKEKIVTPYEAWWGSKPNLSHVKTFGTVAYAHVEK